MNKKLANITNYSKAIVGLLGALGVGLETAYPGAKWTEVVTAGIAALLVYFVPNTKPGP